MTSTSIKPSQMFFVPNTVLPPRLLRPAPGYTPSLNIGIYRRGVIPAAIRITRC